MKGGIRSLCALLAAVTLTGCYNTAVIPETAETAREVQSVPLPPSDRETIALYFTALALQRAHAGASFSEEDKAMLDAFCASQPGRFSVYCEDIYTGKCYLYAETALYYPASMLKAPYALWLCLQADEGVLDLDASLPNLNAGREEDTLLARYNEAAELPAREAVYAMIAQSDNNALELLAKAWPAEESFQTWLQTLDFVLPESCSITKEDGIQGMCRVTDFAAVWDTLYGYFESGAPNAAFLQSCFLAADHPGLFRPEGAPAARKYGSWDYAFHDGALVYAHRPYILICMTDQGNQEQDFPEDAVAAMEQLGRMVSGMLGIP